MSSSRIITSTNTLIIWCDSANILLLHVSGKQATLNADGENRSERKAFRKSLGTKDQFSCDVNEWSRTVACRINVIGQLWHRNFESRLNSGHDLLVTFRRDERDGKTFCPKPTSTPVIIKLSAKSMRKEGERTRRDASSCRHPG